MPRPEAGRPGQSARPARRSTASLEARASAKGRCLFDAYPYANKKHDQRMLEVRLLLSISDRHSVIFFGEATHGEM